jgi:hypothetical protein
MQKTECGNSRYPLHVCPLITRKNKNITQGQVINTFTMSTCLSCICIISTTSGHNKTQVWMQNKRIFDRLWFSDPTYTFRSNMRNRDVTDMSVKTVSGHICRVHCTWFVLYSFPPTLRKWLYDHFALNYPVESVDGSRLSCKLVVNNRGIYPSTWLSERKWPKSQTWLPCSLFFILWLSKVSSKSLNITTAQILHAGSKQNCGYMSFHAILSQLL